MPAVEMDGDEPKIDPVTGAPAQLAVFFPRAEAEIVDTWHTFGMRGTGSADIAVTDLFVPDRRTFAVAPLEKPAPGLEGPLFRMVPLMAVLGEASVGKAKARVEASRDTLYRAAEAAYDEAATGSLLSTDSKVRLQLAVSFAAEACCEAVRFVNEAAGTSAIRLGSPFERYFRDAHVLAQHASKSSPRYASAGRLLFGLENDWIWLSF